MYQLPHTTEDMLHDWLFNRSPLHCKYSQAIGNKHRSLKWSYEHGTNVERK